jgi:hypothetical protein
VIVIWIIAPSADLLIFCMTGNVFLLVPMAIISTTITNAKDVICPALNARVEINVLNALPDLV